MTAKVARLADVGRLTPASMVAVIGVPAAITVGLAVGSDLLPARLALAAAAGLCWLAALSKLSRSWLVMLPVLALTPTTKLGPLDPNFALVGATTLALAVLVFRTDSQSALPRSAYGLIAWLSAGLGLVGLTGANNLQATLYLSLSAFAGLTLGALWRASSPGLRWAATAVSGLGGLACAEFVMQRRFWPEALNGHDVSLGASGSLVRAMANFGHPLVAGAFFAVMAMFALSAPSFRGRRLIIAVLVVATAATLSRSGLLALLVGSSAYALIAADRKFRASLGLAAALGTLAAIVAFVPPVHDAYEQRLADGGQPQVVRSTALAMGTSLLRDDPTGSAVGGGVGASVSLLTARGGIEGLIAFDNQYVTSLIDSGWLLMLATFGGVAWLLVRSGSTHGLPAVLAGLTVSAFADTLTWPSLAVLLWATVGYWIAPTASATRVLRAGEPEASSERAEPARN